MYFCCISLLLCASIAFPSVSTQDDWSGGDGVGGPVAQWEDQYHWALSVCTGIEGEITLGALVDPEIYPLTVECGETSFWVDVNSDGYTDVICMNTPADSLYWLENPIVEGAPWTRHHITAREFIWDFGEVSYLGEFFGVAVAYTEPYEDETIVSVFWGPPSGSFWSLTEMGTLGDKDYNVTLATGDLDNNSYPDIVAAKWAWDEVVVWWDCCAGYPEVIMGPHTPFVTQLEDCDSDGDLEVFIETAWIPSSRLYWNTSSGFQGQYIDECYYTSGKAVTDLDGGAYSEIVFSMFNDLYMYSYETGAGWELEKITSFTTTPLFYDINGDSESDIITSYGGDLVYLFNLGQGNAWREGRFAGGLPSRITSTDIDGNSVADITLYTPYGPACWFHPQELGFAPDGFLESSWLSPETDTGWNAISFESSGASGTAVTIQVRSTNDLSSPPEWSPELPSGSDITPYCSEGEEFFQYRLNLYSNSVEETPTVTSVSLEWTSALERINESVEVSFQPISCPSNSPQLVVRLPVNSGCRVNVFDISGKICWSSEFGVSAGEDHFCVVSGLPAGVYHARLQTGNGELDTRFVVTNN